MLSIQNEYSIYKHALNKTEHGARERERERIDDLPDNMTSKPIEKKLHNGLKAFFIAVYASRKCIPASDRIKLRRV